MTVYIVKHRMHGETHWHVSQEGYSTYEKAVKFIETRSDKPKQTERGWIWESDEGKYAISDITVK